MLIKDLMNKKVFSLKNENTLLDACTMMSKHNIGFIPIVSNSKCISVITDRDIVLLLSNDINLNTTFSNIPKKNVASINEDSKIDEAYELMKKLKISRLVVENDNKNIVGILSASDLVCVEFTDRDSKNLYYEIKQPLTENENLKSNYVKIDDYCL